VVAFFAALAVWACDYLLRDGRRIGGEGLFEGVHAY
jgi:hypothetical protein